MIIGIAVLVVLILIAGFSLIGVRNSIVGASNACEAAWSQIDVQLKRRHDLVPNLVETVKGYAAHESTVFERVANARAEAMRASGVGPTADGERQLTASLADLRAVAESYPRLRATENFQHLAGDLTEIENGIQASRATYNADARGYNTKIEVFPNSLVARRGGFEPREYFQAEEAADREPATVQL